MGKKNLENKSKFCQLGGLCQDFQKEICEEEKREGCVNYQNWIRQNREISKEPLGYRIKC